MTEDQFVALAKLMRLRKLPSAMAAYRHLVHGDRVIDAANYADCTPQAASNCIARCKAALRIAEVAADV